MTTVQAVESVMATLDEVSQPLGNEEYKQVLYGIIDDCKARINAIAEDEQESNS
jgi:hypothetical protein